MKNKLKNSIVFIISIFLVLTTSISAVGNNESLVISNYYRTKSIEESAIINTYIKRNMQNPPDDPETPEGPTEGIIGVEYTFCSSTTDPEEDNLFYQWDWDDGTYSDWYGPYSSGQTACCDHAWSDIGMYCIRVRAKDIENVESGWSEPFCINITGRINVRPLGQAILTSIQNGYIVSNIGDSYNDGAKCIPEPAYNEFSLTIDLNNITSGAELSVNYFSLDNDFMFGLRVESETRGNYPVIFMGSTSGMLSINGWLNGNKVFDYPIIIGSPCGAFQVNKSVYPIDFSGLASGSSSILKWNKSDNEIFSWKYDKNNWEVDHIDIAHINHDYDIGIGNCRVYGFYPQDIGDTGQFTMKHLNARNPPISDLDTNGSLSWTDVQPGSTLIGNFTVKNIGETDSELRWKIDSYPSWGTWTFTPVCGSYLKTEDGQTSVQVEIIAPIKSNKQFNGEIKIVNNEDDDDFDTVEIDLSTPRNKVLINPIFRLLSRFINLYPIFLIIFKQIE
jgi:hypothetical protein